MKTRKLIGPSVVTLALALTGCIPSVHPFYTEQDLISKPGLLGTWVEKGKTDGSENWTFEAGGTNEYRLTVTEKEDKKGKFSAHLFKLKDDYFLDLIPTDCSLAPDQADLVSFALFPGHLLVRVVQFEPELKLAFFDFDKLGKLLKDKPGALAHHQENDRVLLTADTRALQAFVLQHLGEGELFGEPGEMVRKP